MSEEEGSNVNGKVGSEETVRPLVVVATWEISRALRRERRKCSESQPAPRMRRSVSLEVVMRNLKAAAGCVEQKEKFGGLREREMVVE